MIIGNPDIADGVHPSLVIGPGTEVIAGEHLIARPLLQALEHPGPRPAVARRTRASRRATRYSLPSTVIELIACCVIPESAAVIPEFSGAYRRSGVIKEFVERREEMSRLFNVRHMPALVQKHGLPSERMGSVYGMTPGSPLITGLADIPVAAKLVGRLPAADVLLTHSPPAGVNDDPDDPAHVGYDGLRDWVDRHRPRLAG